MKIGDRVFCIHGPEDQKVLGTVCEDNGVNKVFVEFDNGNSCWCKYEWLDVINS